MAIANGHIYYISGYAGGGYYLNRWGSGAVSNHQNVTLYTRTPDPDQQWKMKGVSGGFQILSMLNNAYGLNIYPPNNNNCDLYPVAGNENDAKILPVPLNSSQNIYRLKLVNYDYYLTAASNSSGANVYWAASNGSTSQQWKFEEVGESSSDYQWPTTSQRITQYYSTGHTGVDVGAVVQGVAGDPIYAFADGKVRRTFAWNSSQGTSGNASMGNCVFIHHDNPLPSVGGKYLRTIYMHMNATPLVSTGQYVKKGQIIGYMGESGNASGVHLHFAMQADNSNFSVEGGTDRYIENYWVNPSNYFSFL